MIYKCCLQNKFDVYIYKIKTETYTCIHLYKTCLKHMYIYIYMFDYED